MRLLWYKDDFLLPAGSPEEGRVQRDHPIGLGDLQSGVHGGARGVARARREVNFKGFEALLQLAFKTHLQQGSLSLSARLSVRAPERGLVQTRPEKTDPDLVTVRRSETTCSRGPVGRAASWPPARRGACTGAHLQGVRRAALRDASTCNVAVERCRASRPSKGHYARRARGRLREGDTHVDHSKE